MFPGVALDWGTFMFDGWRDESAGQDGTNLFDVLIPFRVLGGRDRKVMSFEACVLLVCFVHLSCSWC